jgi:BirA family transcriptional regulator, biotin operon repressor / biotin---[acetyl-CoA-carboxylase] ligase
MRELPVRNPFPGASCLLVETTESTQAEARLLPQRGFPPGSLVAAEEQSSGRGRLPGRVWESEKGKNLLFTIYLAPETAALPGLPIRIGRALCDSVEAFARGLDPASRLRPMLKWPNDLMIGDRKAAGILCEAGRPGVFAGIGLNCCQAEFPPELADRATSLELELGHRGPEDRWKILELFLSALPSSLADPRWRQAAESLLWKRGREASFLPGRPAAAGAAEAWAGEALLRGRVEGIDEEGSLLFKAEGERAARAFPAGELS